MKDLLWLLGIIFWPLTAAVIGIFLILSMIVEEGERAFWFCSAVICIFIAAMGGYIAYLGYSSAVNVEAMKVIYLLSIIFWAAVVPLPSKI